MSGTTFSIEIFNGTSCENNDYGVDPMDVIERANELLRDCPMTQLFSDDGFTIEIRREN